MFHCTKGRSTKKIFQQIDQFKEVNSAEPEGRGIESRIPGSLTLDVISESDFPRSVQLSDPFGN
uniref:Uncharacterized protein n=1 Tax=Utricularia reniformis TaxID=192314 RepID=A0A1Y0B0F4_9LAMI|nr:hypothetical protein AEK19_MT0677 [Utricularia reniformis]ART30926.1 hypothetical protein AEK19_MT0677 [Utricularia reniformis]